MFTSGELFIFNPHAEKEMSPRVFWALFYWSYTWAYSIFEEMCLHNAGLMCDSPVGLVFRNLQKACEWSVEDFKIALPNERGESHVVVYSHRCWGPAPVFWAEGSHSQGCSAHRSHRQPEGWRRSAAAGCLPISRKKHHFMMEFHGTSWSAIAGDPQPE